MRHRVCITHSFAIFTIWSTPEELRSNYYSYGMIQAVSNLNKYKGKGCKLVPVDFQPARDYNGS